MIEPARIQAAIEILEQVAESLSGDGPSADVLIRKYFRTRRYAGSKDRRAVTNYVYKVIRNWSFLSETASGDVRRMILLFLQGEKDAAGLSALFTGEAHAPPSLTDEEQLFLRSDHETHPHHRLNYPLWLEDRLKERFQENFEAEMACLNGRASFELRVNLIKSPIDRVEADLKHRKIDVTRGKWAGTSLILKENPRITDWEIYRDGSVEIQDEAAQLAVGLCGFEPGQQVMDLCAGAGGKTLAAAALMENKGQIYAFDNNHHRLKDLKPRAKRANAHIIQPRQIDTAGGKRQKILAEYVAGMDRVVLDVPCSGSGVWRRNPEAKWRLTEKNLEQYCKIQKNLLNEGWAFVKNGGRMIYMTCSLFYQENEGQIEDFLALHKDAQLQSYRSFYKQPDGGSELNTLSSMTECLALSPKTHGTDGFFVAIMEKSA